MVPQLVAGLVVAIAVARLAAIAVARLAATLARLMAAALARLMAAALARLLHEGRRLCPGKASMGKRCVEGRGRWL